jgi:molybdenum cofactor cytidylyltransferase
MSEILGVVPAAGRSARMGNPKPLLEADGSTFLETVVSTLREGGVDVVAVGVREGSGPIHATAVRSGAQVLVPPAVDDGPIASVRAALAWWEREHGSLTAPGALVLLPVDHPKVRPGTVRAMIDAFRSDLAPLVVPAYREKTGHPVLFGRALLEELRGGELEEGARTVVRRHKDEARTVEVDDPGILMDIDTLPDYRRAYPDAFRRRFQKW